MARIRFLPALILTTAALSGCATERRGVDKAVDPARVIPTATPTESSPTATTGERWACSPDQISGFTTDPVVYPARLSLAEVLSRPDRRTTFTVDSNTGRVASVTFRDEGGFIVERLEFERSESVGWHLERGRAC